MSNKKKICTNLLDFFVRMDTIGVDPPGKYTHTHRDTLKGTTNRNTKITVLSIGGLSLLVPKGNANRLYK